MPEQKERLEAFCKFKGYSIVVYYTDAGISAKTIESIQDDYIWNKENAKGKEKDDIEIEI